jgi:MerR family transcriptional regulator, light-induced transcriptional regulator
MTTRDGMRPKSREGMISIGALSRACGIPVQTLRTWERRYGYPDPARKSSGHRLYPLSLAARLRRMGEALARGHRIGDLIHASDEELLKILREAAKPPERTPPANRLLAEMTADGEFDPRPSIAEALAAGRNFDSGLFLRHLLFAWARLGPQRCLDSWVAPLLHEIGQSWREGRLEIRHEHFISERIHDFLRSIRLPQEERASGPPVALATLSGEEHGIGLEMAALVIAQAGLSPLLLGTQMPEEEIAQAARERRARAVAVSISKHMPEAERRKRLRKLRRLLPTDTHLLLGGGGAVPVDGAEVFGSFEELEGWTRRETAALSI